MRHRLVIFRQANAFTTMVLEELGRYRITRHIGDNALGAVYFGMDPLLQRTVVLQTARLDAAAFEQQDFAERFLQSIKAVERLNHPNIATVHDSGREGDRAYIATEYHEGLDLDDLIARNMPPPADLAVELVAGVADGLAYAHRHGVIHQNIAPAYITVLPNGGVKLSGFGIAALQSGRRPDSALQGTPAYLAPEQFSGKPVDGRTDLFSLGVVFYRLLTGKAPFEGDTAAEVMYQIVRKPARWPSRVIALEHRGFDVILAKALAKSPEDRYQTANEFAADLRRASDLAREKLPPWPTGGLAPRKNGTRGDRDEQAGIGNSTRTSSSRRWLYAAVASTLMAGTAVFIAKDRVAEAPASPAPPAAAPIAATAAPILPPPVETPPALPPAAAAPPALPPPSTPEAPSQEPPPAPPIKMATITFAIAPWGEVFINNQSKGISPPLTRLELPPGPVRIEIRNTGARPLVKELVLDEGKAVRLKHKF